MEQNSSNIPSNARLVSLEEIRENFLPLHIHPVPGRDTLRIWFKTLPRFKANPLAKRGGGPTFYRLSDVEKFIRNRTVPCRPSAAA